MLIRLRFVSLIVFAAGWLATSPSSAQVFTDVTSSAGFSGVTNTYGLDWGDYNNDGYPDLYVTGTDKLYKNDGDGTFSNGPSVSADNRAAHWGDYDNDGNLDIGTTWNLYVSRNNGDGSFTQQSNSSIGITSINNLGDFAWLDYNLDGCLDLWAPNGSSPYAYMYSGNGGGTFTAINGGTIGLSANTNGENTIAADYDGDGWIDILYRASSVYLWHNNGNGTFTNVTSSAGISLSGPDGGYNGTAFGDYDNDGDLDLYGGQVGANKLYRNNGDGTFSDVTSSAGVAGPSATTKGVAWGDYDNDGDLDLYVAHEDGANNLYRNNGGGTFTDVASSYGLNISSNSYGVTWEDYDLDGDMDLFVGRNSGASKLFRNNTNNSNFLRVRVVGNGACATNKAGIGVRVDLYNAAGTSYLAGRQIGVANGYGSSEPIWAHFGGLNNTTTYTVRVHFASGAVSTAVMPASVSTTIGSTVIPQMLTVQESAPMCVFTDVSGSTGFNERSTTDYHSGSGLHWGDLDNDGDLDAIATGNSYSRLYLNNNEGVSFSASNFGGGTRSRQGVLLDIDNDGDLDFWHRDEKLYENNGAASFTDRGDLGFSSPNNNEGVAAADIDHDGRCDIVMFSENGNWIGFNSSGSPAALSGTNSSTYGMNDSGDKGNGDFCAAGDVNNDGYLDFFYHYSIGKLFLSDGDDTYTEHPHGISVVTGNYDKMGSAWADYDNDGDLDLFVSRYDSGYTGYLWKNLLVENGSISFSNVTTSAGVTDTSGHRGCCWGDYDNDGDLDLYIVTRSGGANVFYQNQGPPNWNFVAVNEGANAPGDGHDAVFVDYDNDGDLDLAVTQEDAGNTLLRNNTDNTDYLKVRVVGGGTCGTNKAAIGARVELWNAPGNIFLAMREVGVARGYAGAEPMWVHFGGVTNTAAYTVKVRFVGGWSSQTVIPASVSTTIGATVIPQMLTVEEEAVQVVFTDVSSTTGFNVQSTSGWGSGLHWGDLDDDGDLDAIVTGNSSSRLMIYDSAGDTYSVSTFGGGSIYRQGALLDVDNDGDLDFWGMPTNTSEKLFINNGSASFTDAGSAGFSTPDNNEGIAGADVNGDGWCDVLNFSENGNWIGFNDQDEVSPAFSGTNNSSYGLNDSGDEGNGDFCSSGDVNNDGYLDFFYHYNSGKLFLSDGDGTYTQANYGISVVTGNDDKMGSAWGDYDNDGDLDLFVARYDSGQTGYLWRNDVNWTTGSGSFTNITTSAGITDTSVQQGCCWGDYDNDGDLDLYIATRDSAANVLYRNQGDGTFVAACAGTDAPGNAHDAVFTDYDNDGDLDLAVIQESAGNTLLRNNTDDSNYLKVRVVGFGAGGTNVAGVGVRVELWDSASTTFLARRDIGTARGFAGGEPLWAHFGGLTNSNMYKVKVYFHSRSVSEPYTLSVVPVNTSTTIGDTTIPQMLTVEEPTGTVKVIQWREVPNKPAS